MPMVEFRYHQNKISDEQATSIGSVLEEKLRQAILSVRPTKDDYGITVEGDPFGLIALKQSDLRIYIFYHQEWDFSSEDLKMLPKGMKSGVEEILQSLNMKDVTVKIRFYSRSGHTSASIP